MIDKFSFFATTFFLFALGAFSPFQTCLADSSDSSSDNGTSKTYYWQGNQINNLGRLSNSADFEEEQRRTHEGKDADQYLAKIREHMAHQAAADAQEKTALTYQGQLKDNPIELTALSPGLRITLHADAIFDDNSAAMKVGAIDTIERLRTLLDTESQKPLQFVIMDRMDDIPFARDVDAERTLVVISMLEMPKKSDGQENLTSEELTR